MQHSTTCFSINRPLSLGGAKATAGAACLLLSSACHGPESVYNLGYDDIAPPPAAGTAPAPVERTQRFVTELSDFEGLWIGEMRSPLALGESDTYRFPSGSSRIALDLSENDSARRGNIREQINATLTFGEGALLTPPTDATVGYPEGYDYELLSQYTADPENYFPGASFRFLPPLEGFPYQVRRGEYEQEADLFSTDSLAVADGVIRLRFSTSEHLDPWCQLQTPIPSSRGFTCAAGDGGQSDSPGGGVCRVTKSREPDAVELARQALGITDVFDIVDHPDFSDFVALAREQREILSQVDVDCDRLALCRSEACSCDDDSCEGNTGRFGARVLLRRVGDELVGVFEEAVFLNGRGALTPAGEVRLRLTDRD